MDTLQHRLIDLEKVYREYLTELQEDYDASNYNRADEVLLLEAKKNLQLLQAAIKGDVAAQRQVLPLLTSQVH